MLYCPDYPKKGSPKFTVLIRDQVSGSYLVASFMEANMIMNYSVVFGGEGFDLNPSD